MSSIYAVSRGCYSDYSILAVFSTRKQAEKYMAWQNGPERGEGEYEYSDESGIEEWELDIPFTPTGRYLYRDVVDPSKSRSKPWGPYWQPGEDPTRLAEVQWPGTFDKGTYVTGYGPTKEHARRSAAELVRAIRAGTVVNPEAP